MRVIKECVIRNTFNFNFNFKRQSYILQIKVNSISRVKNGSTKFM